MAVMATPEAAIGFAMAIAAALTANNLSTRAGIERGWTRDRINYVAGWISAITFLVAFVAAWMFQPEIASFLDWLGATLLSG